MGQLRELLATGNSALQAGGRALVDSAHALSELVAVQANVASGVAVVGAAKRLLRLCLQVWCAAVTLACVCVLEVCMCLWLALFLCWLCCG